MAEATVSSRKGGDGFFGNVLSGVGAGIGSIGRDLIPIWAAKELKLQSFDQLDATTFDARSAAPRLDDKLRSTGDSAIEATDKVAGIDTTTIMIVGGGVILALGVFLIARN